MTTCDPYNDLTYPREMVGRYHTVLCSSMLLFCLKRRRAFYRIDLVPTSKYRLSVVCVVPYLVSFYWVAPLPAAAAAAAVAR